jgi:hypothetical protein
VELECLETGQRFERKFFVPPKNIGLAHMLLKQTCRPDRQYAAGRVTSLYFDTPDLDEYFKSQSGDFRKDKVRIRWYDTPPESRDMYPVFLELKTRKGFTCQKQRRRFLVPAGRLERSAMGAGIISGAELAETLTIFRDYRKSPLHPVIVISYRRYRFNEMFTGTRISFDYNIRSYVVSPDLGYWSPELRLEGGVIEVKGDSLELPLALMRVKMLGIDWTRFSKYGNCLESHLETAGSAGQLWPAGRTGML